MCSALGNLWLGWGTFSFIFTNSTHPANPLPYERHTQYPRKWVTLPFSIQQQSKHHKSPSPPPPSVSFHLQSLHTQTFTPATPELKRHHISLHSSAHLYLPLFYILYINIKKQLKPASWNKEILSSRKNFIFWHNNTPTWGLHLNIHASNKILYKL